MATTTGVRYGTAEGRWVLLATVLGSGMAALDATVVNVALPAIGRDFGSGISGLQWIVTGYLVTLAALILIGGSLGDRHGRRRVFVIGVLWFASASVLSGLAPSLGLLIAARALQGVGGALLVPGSLALIEAAFRPEDRARAIGAWSGLGGTATAIGPFAGGWLVSAVSWRLIFLLNLPLAAIVLIAARHLPESVDPTATGRLDTAGATLGIVGLAGATWAIIEAPSSGVSPLLIALSGLIGVAGLAGFVLVERSGRHPMLPLDLFANRQFTAANLVTVAVYAALGGAFFLLAVDLQKALRYSPLAAGAALFPVTLLMLALSPTAGALAERLGPRLPMTVGPAIVAVGLWLMRGISPGTSYLPHILLVVGVFGLGLAVTVAPLTATVLAAAEVRHAGVASAVNNAVARVASLLAVALVPLLAGLTGDDYQHPGPLSAGFHRAVTIGAGLCLAASVIAFFGIRGRVSRATSPGTGSGDHPPVCPVDGPPLRTPAV